MTIHSLPRDLSPTDDALRRAASLGMAATINWFLADLVARGLTLDAAEATLTAAITRQAADLRKAGLR